LVAGVVVANPAVGGGAGDAAILFQVECVQTLVAGGVGEAVETIQGVA
jgi:hypothetical protein